jgi:TPR repeat protein
MAVFVFVVVLATSARADVADGKAAFEAGNWDVALAEIKGPAAAGDAEAQYWMGRLYEKGLGVLEHLTARRLIGSSRLPNRAIPPATDRRPADFFSC